MSTRINKYIAESGYCSRRKADQLIADNRVKINGKQAKNGDQVSATDKITIDNNPIKPLATKIYIAFHKPFGAITT
ncbi:23S rRNA pseudouridine(2604) synthase RluF, partial [Candidatus Peregrinibacteria bacterium]|nr:23S rRNA pseudouridine(2604) synthase RluF [Candidatus Peregrinibacteria bacterium]